MPEKYALLNMQTGLDTLNDLLKRQNEMLSEMRCEDDLTDPVNIDAYAAQEPIPDDPDNIDAAIAEIETLIGDPSFHLNDQFTPKTLDEINAAVFDGESFFQQNDPPIADEWPGVPISPTVGQVLDQLWEIEKPKPNKPKKANSAPNNRTRIKSRIIDVVFYLVLAAVVAVAIHMTGGSGNVPRSIFGFSTESVLTGSMQREIPRGSLVFIEHVDPNTIQVGDDVTYMYNITTSVTHKVVAIIEDYGRTGMRGFQTQGVENSDPDPDIVPANNVVGKVVWHVPTIGTVTRFIGAHELLISASLVVIGGLMYLLFITLRYIFRSDKSGKPGKSDKNQDEHPSREKPFPIFIRS